MASDKKVVLIFSDCKSAEVLSASTPSIKKLVEKGAAYSKVKCDGDVKAIAASGNEKGQTLWDAATANGFVVGTLTEAFDMCVLDTPGNLLEAKLAEVLEVADRATLVVLVGKDVVVFYGPGIAKGKVIETEVCPCIVASTVAYVANFPVPENCEAPVAYAALKDINYKLAEIQKLQTAIKNMEAAMERSSRQPWDKHDCA